MAGFSAVECGHQPQCPADMTCRTRHRPRLHLSPKDLSFTSRCPCHDSCLTIPVPRWFPTAAVAIGPGARLSCASSPVFGAGRHPSRATRHTVRNGALIPVATLRKVRGWTQSRGPELRFGRSVEYATGQTNQTGRRPAQSDSKCRKVKFHMRRLIQSFSCG